METKVISPQGKEVIIGNNLPTVLIGERINPFGKGPIKEGMVTGNMEPIVKMAIQQVEDGADILIIRRYTAGEFELAGNRRMYINRGVGHTFPVRFNARPEAALFSRTGIPSPHLLGACTRELDDSPRGPLRLDRFYFCIFFFFHCQFCFLPRSLFCLALRL